MFTDEMFKTVPKFELHAHLNGSLCLKSIKELQNALKNAGEPVQGDDEDIVYSINGHKEVDWEEVFDLFGHVHRLTNTLLGLKLATKLVIRDFAKDHVVYLELRTTAKDNEHMTKREYLICVLEAIKNADEVKEGKIQVKLLPSINRAHAVKEAEETLDIVLALCEGEYKNLIAGLDFSGDPTKGDFKDFIPVLTKARKHEFPLTIHCGEINNPEEIELMLDFGMQRCGHGTFLTDEQRARLAENDIPTESCISSNVLCGTVRTFETHHIQDLITQNYPVVVCTDDCGIFNTTLSRELGLTALTFRLQTDHIIELIRNSLKYTFLSEDEKLPFQKKLDEFLSTNLKKRVY